MSEIVPVSILVLVDLAGSFVQGSAGTLVRAGQPCAREPTGARYVLASASTEALAQVSGLASHDAAEGQPLRLLVRGVLDLGADVLVPGMLYAAAGTPGNLTPIDLLASGDYTAVLGQALDSRRLQVHLHNYPIPRA